MRRFAAAAISSLVAYLFAVPLASSAGDAPASSGVLAVVGATSITVETLVDEMRRRGGSPGRFDTPGGRAALLDELIRAEAVHAAALRAGYEKKPEIIRDIRGLVMNRYLEDNLAPALAALTVSDDEVAAYHREHEGEFSSPRMVRGAQIRIAVPAKASAEKRAELRARAEAARAAALALPPSQRSFGSVAVTYSDDQATRYRGGDLGLLRAGQADPGWDEGVLRALLALGTPGELSPVVEGRDGYYLVKLAEVREPAVRPLGEVREQIRQRILREKQRKAEEEFFATLRAPLKISVDRELLEKVTPPAIGGPGLPPALPGKP